MGGENGINKIENGRRSDEIESIPLQPIKQSLAADELDSNHDKSFLDHVKEKWRNVATFVCLWLALLTCTIAYSLLSPFFPTEVEKRGFSSLWTGVIVSCAPLTVVVTSPIIGYFLPYFGVRVMATSGLLLIGGAYILLGFSDLLPFSWVFVPYTSILRMVEGLGTGILSTTTFSLLPDLFPNSISTAMGLLEVSSGLGYALGPVLGGFLFELGGFKLPFFTVGVLVWILILPYALLVKGNIARKQNTASSKGLFLVLADFIFVLLVLTHLQAFALMGFFSPVFQPFLSKQFDLGPLQVGLVFFSANVAYFVTAFVIGPLSDKLGRRWFIVVGSIAASLTQFVVGPAEFIATPRLWLTWFAFVAGECSCAFVLVPFYADLLSTAKERLEGIDTSTVTAVLSGVVASSISLGWFPCVHILSRVKSREFLGPVISGVLAEFFSFSTSAFLFGEVFLAQGLTLMGATLIEQFTRPGPP